jgi:hypothetical protein
MEGRMRQNRKKDGNVEIKKKSGKEINIPGEAKQEKGHKIVMKKQKANRCEY